MSAPAIVPASTRPIPLAFEGFIISTRVTVSRSLGRSAVRQLDRLVDDLMVSQIGRSIRESLVASIDQWIGRPREQYVACLNYRLCNCLVHSIVRPIAPSSVRARGALTDLSIAEFWVWRTIHLIPGLYIPEGLHS